MPNGEYVSVSLTAYARDVLRQLTLQVSVELGRQVSMSEALRVAGGITRNHMDQVRPKAREMGIDPHDAQPTIR